MTLNDLERRNDADAHYLCSKRVSCSCCQSVLTKACHSQLVTGTCNSTDTKATFACCVQKKNNNNRITNNAHRFFTNGSVYIYLLTYI